MTEDERQIEMLEMLHQLTSSVSRLEASQAGIRRMLSEIRDLLAGETRP